MKYYFKENFRLLYADGQLYDANNDPVYTYQNNTLILPEIELRQYGNLVGYVKQNFTLLLKSFDIYLGNEYVDSLQEKFRLFVPELYLEKLGWRIEGDFLSLNYEIHDEDNKLICEVNQELFRLTRRYYVNIFDEDREPLIILLVLAINQFDKEKSADAASSASSNSNH